MGIGAQHGGHEWKFHFLEAATWGTGMIDSSTPVELSGDSVVITPDIKVRHRNAFRGQNWPDIADMANTSKGSLPSCVIPTQVIKTEIPDFLFALFQNVSEAVDPFQKTFTFASPAPDFSASPAAGYWMTLWAQAPVASTDQKINTLIAERLEFTISPEANDGNLFMTATMKGIGHSYTVELSGTPVKSTFAGFNFFDIAVCTFDGSAFIPEEITLVFENTIKGVGYDDTLDTYASLALTHRSCSATIKGMWETVSRGGLTKFGSGAESDFIINWGATGVDGFLSFAIKGAVTEGQILTEDLTSINLTLTGASDIANTEAMSTVEICDAVDRSW